ncbi:hypothetical protein [Streptomyces sp. NPDC091371]|uniref:hypothetical protein n=1 Tax=Streptomyces sp. NPDC091371 TaxID=3155303 RepID=UPI0034323036
MMRGRARAGRLAACLAAAELRLDSDGRFSATDVVTDGFSAPADFSGRWEWLDEQASSDFIYLSVENGGLGTTAGIRRANPRSADALRITGAENPSHQPFLIDLYF